MQRTQRFGGQPIIGRLDPVGGQRLAQRRVDLAIGDEQGGMIRPDQGVGQENRVAG
ncbi:Uncharacterised protein [Bordetella pertussis]|nr:Uncharacterised protein [Bordetella pertussis]